MKNNKFLKISALILALTLCIGMILPLTIGAEDAQTETKPEIISQNVTYNEKFCLMYAVDASTVAEGPVTLYLYEANPEEGAKAVKSYEVNEVTAAYGNLPVDSYIFTTDGVAAYAMAQNFYVQAVDAAGNASDVKKYSVGEYLYERLADSTATVKQKNFYNATLDFGASAQKVILKETDEAKYINNYVYVTSIDGTTVNGFNKGIFPKGAELTLAKAGANELTAISYDKDGGYMPKITDGAFTVPADAVSVEVSAGRRVIYRDSIQTFESYTAGETGYFTAEGSFADKKFVDAGGDHGIAYSATFNSGAYLYRGSSNYPDTTIAAADEATAVEFSFDIRVTLDKTVNTSSDPFFCFDQRFNNGSSLSSTAARTQAHFKNGYLELQSSVGSAVGSGRTSFEDAKLGEWFHIRVVSYEGDSNKYYYINGSDTPFYDTRSSGSAYEGDVSLLTQARLSVFNASGAGFTIEIDNLFYGYTMDKNPGIAD